ncbi:DNA-binding transcriptional regulator, LysR family [Balnearium lithotrophicum]|uniref:DNA-binding transcriptional regulator, LysR family n=1 Tax=Balnearium lithotrophicum TaxID=223788 RepID=A0A521D874_9BACT|nr:selenium metabolism-associated LysR family transcriptional regulator [Balnearium lithotrophicum]SMO67906.1 DNA-binding transcriptional regulator, LysR family [Balnearium lithotrophicum]
MDIKQLEVFARVFENNSFSKAAHKLGLSQPTVSAHIQNLEESIGKKLFDRVGRRIVPTQEAKILYRHAVEILKKRDEALSELRSLNGKGFSGLVRVAASNIPGDYFVPHMLKRIREKFPKVLFRVEILDSSKVLKALTEQIPIYDLGFVGMEPQNKRLESKRIHDDEIVLIAPPYFKKEEVELKEVLQLPLLFREEESGTRKTVEGALKELGIGVSSLNVVAYLGSNTAIKEAVKKGIGFGLVSRYSVQDDVKCGKLKIVKVNGLNIKRFFYAVKRKDITPLPVVKEIWDRLEKLL